MVGRPPILKVGVRDGLRHRVREPGRGRAPGPPGGEHPLLVGPSDVQGLAQHHRPLGMTHVVQEYHECPIARGSMITCNHYR